MINPMINQTIYELKQSLQKILKEFLHTEGKNKPNHKRSVKPHQRNRQSEISIELAAHIQILKKQKQLNGRNHHILLNINTECLWTLLLHQKKLFGKLD
jgi:uridine kinase